MLRILNLFQECQEKLGHLLPLSAYLLKPVQRITKYQLLLREMMKLTVKNSTAYDDLEVTLLSFIANLITRFFLQNTV